ncbi:MAG: glycosyltransferase family 2 protein [Candidatus Omnitrophica bacterium]|nr:glycosyltransferase family 2 protein [Candidatus Omnitrophota bacterium]MCM8817280.1 glycosyltransferase family 2 protein [Candidatus Omnitrophota bacterium]
MLVSIVIPVFNEEKTILEILGRVIGADIGNCKKQIIVVNDGSTDETPKILNQVRKKYNNILLINHIKNKGKAAALRTGFSYVKGEIIIIQDADLEYDPSDYYKLIAPIINDEADIVFGTRFHFGRPKGMPLIRYICNRFLSFLCRFLHNIRVSDMETGYKVFSRKVLEKMEIVSNGFDFEPEFTILAAKQKFRIKEISINYKPRSVAHGKKIRLKDGLSALLTIIKMKFKR